MLCRLPFITQGTQGQPLTSFEKGTCCLDTYGQKRNITLFLVARNLVW